MSHFETDKIASLAYLQLRPAEKEALYTSMDNILGFVETIAKLNVSDVQPMVRAVPIPPASRPDEVLPGLSPADLAQNIVKMDEGSIIVPQVIKK